MNNNTQNEIIISTNVPQHMRNTTILLAVALTIFSAWQLIGVFRHFSNDLIIVCIAYVSLVYAGLRLLYAMITAFDEEWTIRRKIITIKATRRDLIIHSEILYSNIIEHKIETRRSKNGPNTYVIEFKDNKNDKFISPHFDVKDDAQYAIDLFFAKS